MGTLKLGVLWATCYVCQGFINNILIVQWHPRNHPYWFLIFFRSFGFIDYLTVDWSPRTHAYCCRTSSIEIALNTVHDSIDTGVARPCAAFATLSVAVSFDSTSVPLSQIAFWIVNQNPSEFAIFWIVRNKIISIRLFSFQSLHRNSLRTWWWNIVCVNTLDPVQIELVTVSWTMPLPWWPTNAPAPLTTTATTTTMRKE